MTAPRTVWGSARAAAGPGAPASVSVRSPGGAVRVRSGSPTAASSVAVSAAGAAAGGELRRRGRQRGPGDAEVQHLDLPGLREHHVLRLEVPVHHALGVRRHQGRGDLPGDGQALRGVQSVADGGHQIAAPDQLEHQVVPVLALDEVVDLADVGMVEPRKDLRLADEPGLGLRAQPVAGLDRLERNLALEGLVMADVDLSHTAPAEHRLDTDPADSLADVRDGDSLAWGTGRNRRLFPCDPKEDGPQHSTAAVAAGAGGGRAGRAGGGRTERRGAVRHDPS